MPYQKYFKYLIGEIKKPRRSVYRHKLKNQQNEVKKIQVNNESYETLTIEMVKYIEIQIFI